MKRRSSGEGTVFFWDKKGLWVGRITLPDGKRKVKYSKVQSDVKKWLLAKRSELRDGVLPKDDNITFSQFVASYMETAKHNLRPKTIEAYSYLIRVHIVPAIGSIKLTQLRPDHLQSFYNQKLESGLSKRTVQFMHSVIHKALDQAMRWGMVPRNVADLVEAPRPQRKTPVMWTPDEVNIFKDAAKNSKYELIFLLSLYCGFRQGEVLGIHYEDVSITKGTIRVEHTVQPLKGGLVIGQPKTESSRRTVTVPKDVLVLLQKHIYSLNKDQGLIFTSNAGNPISASNVIKEFKKILEVAGLPQIRFHDLRHVSASLLLLAGVDIKTIQKRLGHSQISTTMDIYTNVLPTLQDDAAERMNALLSRPSGIP